MGTTRIAALAFVALALQFTALPSYARIGSCAGCGTVVDVDPIYYERAKAPDVAAAGTIIGGTINSGGRSATATGVAMSGLIGREARGNDRGNDERGLRLELKMDGGGQRTIEVSDGMRIYRGDRVRVYSDRIELLD